MFSFMPVRFHCEQKILLSYLLTVFVGDFSDTGTLEQVSAFMDWMEALPYGKKVFIAG